MISNLKGKYNRMENKLEHSIYMDHSDISCNMENKHKLGNSMGSKGIYNILLRYNI